MIIVALIRGKGSKILFSDLQKKLFPAVFLAGFLVTRLIQAVIFTMSEGCRLGFILVSVIKFWDNARFEDCAAAQIEAESKQDDPEAKKGDTTGLKDSRVFNYVMTTYRVTMVAADMLCCLAHGANDVANGIAPLL